MEIHTISDNILIVQVRVKHGSGQILDENDKLSVYTNEPRENGRANADVIRQLSAHFNVDPSRIRIIRGIRSSNKTVRILD